MLDGATANITVNGQPVKQVVLDLGGNEPMIHQRLIQTWADVNPNGRRIVGITGAPHMMPRTVDALTVALFPDDSDKEALASDRMMVMQGDALPDLLLDCEMMAQLGIVVDPASWTATFQARPYQEPSKPVVLPLVRPTQAQLAALAEMQGGRTWPESWVTEEAPEGEIAIPPLMADFQGLCFTAAADQSSFSPADEVGGLSGTAEAQRPTPDFSSFSHTTVEGTHAQQAALMGLSRQRIGPADPEDQYVAVWGGDPDTFPADMPYRQVYTALFEAMEET